jgi:hypothetical protein
MESVRIVRLFHNTRKIIGQRPVCSITRGKLPESIYSQNLREGKVDNLSPSADLKDSFMLDESELNKIIDMLNGSLDDVHKVIEELYFEPTGDERIWPYLEAHLDNRTPIMLGTNSHKIWYGELRWKVAETLGKERRKAGIDEILILSSVTKPITGGELGILAREAGIIEAESALDLLAKLIEMGKVPLTKKGY